MVVQHILCMRMGKREIKPEIKSEETVAVIGDKLENSETVAESEVQPGEEAKEKRNDEDVTKETEKETEAESKMEVDKEKIENDEEEKEKEKEKDNDKEKEKLEEKIVTKDEEESEKKPEDDEEEENEEEVVEKKEKEGDENEEEDEKEEKESKKEEDTKKVLAETELPESTNVQPEEEKSLNEENKEENNKDEEDNDDNNKKEEKVETAKGEDDAAVTSNGSIEENEKKEETATQPDTGSVEGKPQIIEVEEYLVKYRNFSYLHCEWRTEEELYKGDKRIQAKLKRFKQKMQQNTNIFENVCKLLFPFSLIILLFRLKISSLQTFSPKMIHSIPILSKSTESLTKLRTPILQVEKL